MRLYTTCHDRNSTNYGKMVSTKGEEEFRDALAALIYDLVGKQPRIAIEANGNHAIYYS
jgi:hypothetical protein